MELEGETIRSFLPPEPAVNMVGGDWPKEELESKLVPNQFEAVGSTVVKGMPLGGLMAMEAAVPKLFCRW